MRKERCWVTFRQEQGSGMARSIPTVWVCWSAEGGRAELERTRAQGGCIRLDTPAWEEWLEGALSRSFAYPLLDRAGGFIAGFMTVRKERRARGGHYWVAYRRAGGRVGKVYLGRSAEVTAERLAAVAARFQQGVLAVRAPSEERR
jgi:hypothetical protein